MKVESKFATCGLSRNPRTVINRGSNVILDRTTSQRLGNAPKTLQLALIVKQFRKAHHNFRSPNFNTIHYLIATGDVVLFFLNSNFKKTRQL